MPWFAKTLRQDFLLEIDFNCLFDIESITKISRFIEIDYNKESVSKRINK